MLGTNATPCESGIIELVNVSGISSYVSSENKENSCLLRSSSCKSFSFFDTNGPRNTVDALNGNDFDPVSGENKEVNSYFSQNMPK